MKKLFETGLITYSEGVEDLGIDLDRLIERHRSGDWGDVTGTTLRRNQDAIETGDLSDQVVSLFLTDGAVIAVSTCPPHAFDDDLGQRTTVVWL